jgi:hypothetical protein
MEEIKFEGMQKLMSSVERAKLVGLIKQPQEITITEKNNILNKGIVIGAILIFITVVIVLQIDSRKKDEKASE